MVGEVPDDKEASVKSFICDLTDEAWTERIGVVLPNFRDISVSSCTPRIKSRCLFRSARPFGDYHAIEEVLLKYLGITTIIDLRDDNLLALREEDESRIHVSKIYQLKHMSQRMNRITSEPRGTVQMAIESGMMNLPTLFVNRPNAADTTDIPDKLAEESFSSPSSGVSVSLRDTYAASRVEELVSKHIPEPLAKEIVSQPGNIPLYEFVMKPESANSLLVVNVLDAPAVKKRVLQHATERANLPFLPGLVAAKAIDKITGQNNLAPYYFCRFVVSSHEIQSTYYEMLDYCGQNFAYALKIIALATGPVLFHCSLGKDRTGVLSMLLLHILGATEQAIIFDYSLTEQANMLYREYSKSGLPESFCAAGAEIMRLTIDYVKEMYGSFDSYLDGIGFTDTWRQLVQQKYLVG